MPLGAGPAGERRPQEEDVVGEEQGVEPEVAPDEILGEDQGAIQDRRAGGDELWRGRLALNASRPAPASTNMSAVSGTVCG